jgi:glutaredoxin
MEFPEPQRGIITVYSKSGCIKCSKVKTLLNDKTVAFTVINCDEFILNNKEEFLSFIHHLIGKEYNMFPIVFDNKQFIGGYNETKYFTTLLQSDKEELLDFDMSF